VGEGTEDGKLESYKGSVGQAGRRIRMASSGGCAREKINEAVSQLARQIKKREKRGIIYRRSPPHSHPIYGGRATDRVLLLLPLFFSRRSGSGLGLGDVGTKGEDKASTCFLARLRQEMLLCRACPHGLVSSASLPCRPAPSAGARGVGRLCESASLAAADLGIFCCQIFRFLEKKCSDLLLNNNVRVSCRCSDCRIFSSHLKKNFALLFVSERCIVRMETKRLLHCIASVVFF